MARFGGDEFVLLVEDVNDRAAVEVVARNLLAAVVQPVQIGGQECRITASIGIALCPDDAQEAEALLKHADLAMYHAKEQGKNGFQYFSPTMGAQSTERVTDRDQPERRSRASRAVGALPGQGRHADRRDSRRRSLAALDAP